MISPRITEQIIEKLCRKLLFIDIGQKLSGFDKKRQRKIMDYQGVTNIADIKCKNAFGNQPKIDKFGCTEPGFAIFTKLFDWVFKRVCMGYQRLICRGSQKWHVNCTLFYQLRTIRKINNHYKGGWKWKTIKYTVN